MLLAVPGVEVSYDTDVIRGGRPNSKRNSALAFMCDRMCAELVVNLPMLAFAEEMEIEIAEGWREAADCVRSPSIREGSIRDRALASDTSRLFAFARGLFFRSAGFLISHSLSPAKAG